MAATKALRLLDHDPDLAALVPETTRALALERAVARTSKVGPGRWQYQPLRDPSAFGLLVVDGLLGARVAVDREVHLEVLGEGDLLRPWVHLEPEASVPSSVGWQVFEDTRVALLDEHFARAVAPWPQLASALMHRLILRVRRLSFQLALAGIERVDERLLTALWHFSDRWGSVTPEGVVMRLALTHSQLAEVIRAARPSVSSAIGDLRRRGAISVDRANFSWTLLGSPPEAIGQLRKQVGLPSPAGQSHRAGNPMFAALIEGTDRTLGARPRV